MLLAQPLAVPGGIAPMDSHLPLLSVKLAEDCQSGSARQGTVDLFRKSFPDASISYVGMSIKGEGNWVATSDNYLKSGMLNLKLHPSHQSLAGSAVACCALLTSADDGLPERMYDVEHAQSMGRDVVLMAIPMGVPRPFTLSSGTAFPGAVALGALLVAIDKQSASHPRVLTDVCCLAETLAPLIEEHAHHAASLLQEFVLSFSSAGSPITAAGMLSSPQGLMQQQVTWPENASLSRDASTQSSTSTSTSISERSRSRSLPQQVKRMSNSFLERLRSQVRQPDQAEAAASVLGRPKTPVQYVRAPGGPSASLSNPFAGVPESSPASPLQASSPTAGQSDSGAQLQMAPEEQMLPGAQPQPSAAQRKAAKASKWEMLLAADEPELPAEPEPGPPEQSAPSAAQPKMALRFQMMIDSQELDAKRQRDAYSKVPGPSLSAAVYPVGSSQQSSTQPQGHQSMPSLQSSMAPSQQQRGRKLKPWELLLAAQEAEGSASATEPDSQQLSFREPQAAVGAQQAATPSAADHTQMIARWERMLDKRSSQQSATVPQSATASPDRQPSFQAAGPAAGQSNLHQGKAFQAGQVGMQQAPQHESLPPNILQTPWAGAAGAASGSERDQAPGLESLTSQEPLAQASRAAFVLSASTTALPATSGLEPKQRSQGSIAQGISAASQQEQSAQSFTDRPSGSAVVTGEGGQSSLSPAPLEEEPDKVAGRLGSTTAEQHPVWLCFKDAGLEEGFAWWHNVQMQKVDKISTLFALLIFSYLGFCWPHRLAFTAPILYSMLMAVMITFFWLAWTQHPSYMLHRIKLAKAIVVVYILFNTQVAFPRVLRGMSDAAACATPFVLRYINAQPLLTSCLTTMVRVRIHVPLQLLMLALSWRLPGLLCPLCFAAEAQWRCLLRMHALQILVGFVAPTALIYKLEQRMRSTFLHGRRQKLAKAE